MAHTRSSGCNGVADAPGRTRTYDVRPATCLGEHHSHLSGRSGEIGVPSKGHTGHGEMRRSGGKDRLNPIYFACTYAMPCLSIHRCRLGVRGRAIMYHTSPNSILAPAAVPPSQSNTQEKRQRQRRNPTGCPISLTKHYKTCPSLTIPIAGYNCEAQYQ